MGQIYLVRHGQASFGSADYDQLSELGLEQSRLLGAALAKSGQAFQRVVTGDMKRHRQTAEACLSALPAAALAASEWRTDPDFNEYDHHEVMLRHRPAFGDAREVERFLASTPRAKQAFQEIFEEAMARWMSGRHDADYREPWPVFRRRCVAALRRLVDSAGKSQTIIVFTSGGTVATICREVLGLDDRQTEALNWTLVNCAVTKLLFQPGRVSLSYLNSYAHLESSGRQDVITYR